MKAATESANYDEIPKAISIHAAREGGDAENGVPNAFSQHISIHAAREGGDLRGERIENMINEFQSTPPVKAATLRVYNKSIK